MDIMETVFTVIVYVILGLCLIGLAGIAFISIGQIVVSIQEGIAFDKVYHPKKKKN